MPTPQDLDRLRALLAQLQAIGSAQRGELIRAEDWNTLVAALADVARAVLAADASSTVPPHAHPDQVNADWLSPGLRDLLERGPLADPAMQQRLTGIEQTQRRFNDTLDATGSRIEEFRSRITDVGSRDLERQAAVTSVQRRLDGVVDPRADLQAMRTTLATVENDLGQVREAAARLSVNGQVVDVGQLVSRVTDLEAMRDRFKGANGELLDAATIERRLAEVDQRAITPEALNDALNQHHFQLDEAQATALEDKIGNRQRDLTNAALDGLRGELDSKLTQGLQGLPGLVDARLTDALPGIEGTLTNTLGGRIDAAQAAATAAAQEAAQRAVDAGSAALRTDFNARLDALNAGLAAQVGTQLDARLATALAPLNSRLDAAASRLDGLAGQLGPLADTQKAHATLLAALPAQLASLRTDLTQSLKDEVALQVGALNSSLTDRLAAFTRDNDQKLAAMRTDITTQATDAARNAATAAAQASSTALRTQLLAEMRGVARDEVSVAVNDSVRTAVDKSVSAQLAGLPTLVGNEVRRQQLVVRPVSPVSPVTPVTPVTPVRPAGPG